MESAIHLPPDVADLPGRIRLYPFQRGIASAISDPLIERVTVLKSARVGYSTLLIGMLGNFVGNDPAPILAVVPTDDDARTLVTGMVEPIFAE
jgi:phage terminase large subunit GpA-like protein